MDRRWANRYDTYKPGDFKELWKGPRVYATEAEAEYTINNLLANQNVQQGWYIIEDGQPLIKPVSGGFIVEVPLAKSKEVSMGGMRR